MIWLKIMGGILVVLFGFYQLGFFGKMLSDHPATGDRLERIREQIDQ